MNLAKRDFTMCKKSVKFSVNFTRGPSCDLTHAETPTPEFL